LKKHALAMRNATLIIGGGGFIGKRLSAALRRAGQPVAVLGRGIEDAISADFVQRRGSVEDAGLLRELLEISSCVVYLASVTTPSASAREPGLEVTGNLLPLARFLEIAQAIQPRKLVFISSAGAVYGDNADGVAENVALRPRSFYGAGKAAAEAMLHAFAVNSGWPAIALRPTNVYGPGQLPIKGFAIVPTIFRHLLERRVFEIWGDGSVVRDYLFVDDLCELISRVVGACEQGYSVYNAGSGSAVSVLELIQYCEQAAGMKLDVTLRPARSVDVARAIPDIGAVNRAYDWRARTPLHTGLGDTWQWLRSSVTSTANIS
jgi:UDP-glucose 4-epimerase